MSSEASLSADAQSAVDFLIKVLPEGPWSLSAGGGDLPFVTRTFASNDFLGAKKFISERNAARQNIYWGMCPPKGFLRKKAKKDEIDHALMLWADIDPDKDSDLGAERDRIRRMVLDADLRPSVIVDSGRGFWGFFLLAAPVHLDGADGRATVDFEGRLRWLRSKFGGDPSACEIAKIGRLPFTVNWPDAKKAAGGARPALATVIEFTDSRYELSAFGAEQPTRTKGPQRPAAVPAQIKIEKVELDQLSRWGVPPRAIAVIKFGRHPDEGAKKGDDTRSGWLFDALCAMARAGVPDEAMVAVITDPAYGISASVLDKGPNTLKYARRQVEQAIRTVSASWVETTKNGDPIRSYRNTRAAIQRLGIICQHDTFRDLKLLGGHQIGRWVGELRDDACVAIRQMVTDEFGFDPGSQNVSDAALGLCLENPFDPVVDELEGLVWDGEPRIGTWAVRYLGAPDTPLHREFGRLFLIAAVRRARQPGTKYDTILVLQGGQGTGKSTALRILAGDLVFSDQEILHLDQRGQQEASQGVWIHELGELAGLRKTATEKVKAFASRTHDIARPAYGRFKSRQPRRCVYAGTTNDEAYLRDPTGNRRFWPLPTTQIDLEGIARDRTQLWAEASKEEAEGGPLTLPASLWAEAAEAQENAREDDPWLDLLADVHGEFCGNEERVSSAMLLSEVLNLLPAQQTPQAGAHLADCMHRLGWQAKKQRIGGGAPQRGYVRPFDQPRWDEAERRKARQDGQHGHSSGGYEPY